MKMGRIFSFSVHGLLAEVDIFSNLKICKQINKCEVVEKTKERVVWLIWTMTFHGFQDF